MNYEFTYFSREHDYWLGPIRTPADTYLAFRFRTKWSTTSKPIG
jgi:hypothetical protein